MDKSHVSHLAWHWSRWRRIGRRRALAGVALLLYSLGLCLLGLFPAKARIEAMREQALALEARPAPVAAENPGAAQLAAFYGGFPESAEAPEWLARIHAAGAAAELPLEQAEYRFQTESASGLATYEINLPLRGAYPQIRRFIDGLLADIPALALRNVRLERENIGDPDLAVRLKLVLFLRREGS